MKPTEYSLSQAFKRIEEELIKSMIRNFEKHKADELEEGFNWEQWQVVQLKELEKYRKENREKFDEEFKTLNGQLDELLRMTNEDAQTKQEAILLDQIKKGVFTAPQDQGINTTFFAINENKLNSLIQATTDDLDKAEHAVLRKSNDLYRKVIYDAQVYAANGGTYEQAIDMATKDFCKNGITSIVYKNGSRHTIQDYAGMAIRTANKRAYLLGEGKKHAEFGVHTVRVNKRSDACPLCLRWTGKVLIDDVYGGGTKEEARRKRLPLLSTAMAKGFLHPNCKDVYSLYIDGVSPEAEPWTEYELRVLADQYNYEQKEKHAKTMIQGWTRVAETRLDPENKKKAEALADGWRNTLDDLKKVNFSDKLEDLSPGWQQTADFLKEKGLDERWARLGEKLEGYDISMMPSSGISQLNYDQVESTINSTIPLIEDIREANSKIMEDYPLRVDYGSSGMLALAPTSKNATLQFNAKYFTNEDGLKELRDRIEIGIKNRYFLEGTTPDTLATHELGHYVEWLLCARNEEINGISLIDSWNDKLISIDISKEAMKLLGTDGKGLLDSEGVRAGVISKRAWEDPQEMVAEAFHDVYGIRKDNASEFNKKIVEIALGRLASYDKL